MSIFHNPYIGALLNLLWFGLADIYVGKIITGFLKILMHLSIVWVLGTALSHTQPPLLYLGVQLLVLIWGISTMIMGYRTVAQQKY
jgi:hypothetical protein